MKIFIASLLILIISSNCFAGITENSVSGQAWLPISFRSNMATTDPASGKDGQVILNTTDNKLKVWYNSSWNTLAVLTPATQENIIFDGENVIFDGEQLKGQS